MRRSMSIPSDHRDSVAQALLPVRFSSCYLSPELHSHEWLCYLTVTMTYYERNLPHWHPDGREIFLTWRLYRSLPERVSAELRSSKKLPRLQFALAEQFLDQAVFAPQRRMNTHISETYEP